MDKATKADWLRQMRESKFADRTAGKPADKPAPVAQKLKTVRDAVNNRCVINKPTATLSTTLSTRNAQKQEKWRKANPELHRQRSREAMRKLRAARASGKSGKFGTSPHSRRESQIRNADVVITRRR